MLCIVVLLRLPFRFTKGSSAYSQPSAHEITTTRTLFCDETGSTGSRFFDLEQPVYVEGGWFVARKNVSRVAQAAVAAEQAQSLTFASLRFPDLVFPRTC
jgi:hypothetical protein